MEDIEELCSSNKSYKEKIKKLEELKTNAELNINAYKEYINLIDNSKRELVSGKYLGRMIQKKEELNKKILIKIPTSLILLTSGVVLTSDLSKVLTGEIHEDELSIGTLLFVVIGTAIADSLSLILVPSTIKDIYNRKLYSNELSSYQRRLK